MSKYSNEFKLVILQITLFDKKRLRKIIYLFHKRKWSFCKEN